MNPSSVTTRPQSQRFSQKPLPAPPPPRPPAAAAHRARVSRGGSAATSVAPPWTSDTPASSSLFLPKQDLCLNPKFRAGEMQAVPEVLVQR